MVSSRPYRIGDAGTAEIRDAYLEFGLDNGLLRIGKQQIVWGRLDGIKVLDTVNPQDFREFILDDFDDSRIRRKHGVRPKLGTPVPRGDAGFEYS